MVIGLETGRARLKPVLFQAPDQEVDAVLAEEGLVLVDHGRHAPMAGRFQGGLVVCNGGVEPVGFSPASVRASAMVSSFAQGSPDQIRLDRA